MTTETVPIAADANYHTYTIYEIDSNLVYQRGRDHPESDRDQPARIPNLSGSQGRRGGLDFCKEILDPGLRVSGAAAGGVHGRHRERVAPLTVNFTDTSLNSPTAWAWDFGDGQTSTRAGTRLTRSRRSGNYAVTLTATNLRGSDTYAATVQAVADSNPEFGANITKGVAP